MRKFFLYKVDSYNWQIGSFRLRWRYVPFRKIMMVKLCLTIINFFFYKNKIRPELLKVGVGTFHCTRV